MAHWIEYDLRPYCGYEHGERKGNYLEALEYPVIKITRREGGPWEVPSKRITGMDIVFCKKKRHSFICGRGKWWNTRIGQINAFVTLHGIRFDCFSDFNFDFFEDE